MIKLVRARISLGVNFLCRKYTSCSDPITRINVHDEYSPLQSVVIGYTDENFRFPLPGCDVTFDYVATLASAGEAGIFDDFVASGKDVTSHGCKKYKNNSMYAVSRDLIMQENKNLDMLAALLTKMGIKVYRPNI